MSSVERKFWHLIPTEPKFGSLIDEDGGRSQPAKNEVLDVVKQTLIGKVDIHEDDGGLDLYVSDMGIDMHYEKNGKLTRLELDVFSFFTNCSDEQLMMMGGDVLEDLADLLMENDSELTVRFDILNNKIFVTEANLLSEKRRPLPVSLDQNFSVPTLLTLDYEDLGVCIGVMTVEDEFRFGLLIKKKEDELTSQTKIYMYNVLKDCNYRTFLESEAKDKYDKLMKRIFLS